MTGKVCVALLCLNNDVCIHFEKLLIRSLIQVSKASLCASPAIRKIPNTNLSNFKCYIQKKNSIVYELFFCVIPSKISIAFIMVSIL